MILQPSQFGRLEIPYHKVLARLGYARGKTALDEKTEVLIRQEIEIAGKLINARQATAESAVRISGQDTVLLEPGLTIQSRSICALLDGCTTATGFAVTLGPGIEEKCRQYLADKEPALALLLDAAGSVAVEELANLTHRQIDEAAAQKGLTATRRFSPGYGDWELHGQQEFLAWLAAGRIGIRLTENFQMLPEKSVSALLGLLPAATST